MSDAGGNGEHGVLHRPARLVGGVLLVLSLGLWVFPALAVGHLLLLGVAGPVLYRRSTGRGAAVYVALLDDLAFSGERALVAAAMLVMAVVVFIDVVWRTSHGAEPATLAGLALGIAALCVAAAGSTTTREGDARTGRRAVPAVALMACTALLLGAVHGVQSGFGWSQRLALVLMLWVGMLGASMAAREGRHIEVDAAARLCPLALRPAFTRARRLLTLAITCLLAALALRYTRAVLDDWLASDMRSAVFESLPIPYWAAALPIALGFSLLSARTARAAWAGEPAGAAG